MIGDLPCTILGTFLGVVLWACPASSQVSPLPANNVMASPSGSTGYLAPRPLVSADLFQANSCPVGQVFYNNSGAIGCLSTSGGSVLNVSWVGGIVSIATPASTPSFTIAGTSGGIPYFSSGTTWASSGALAANSIVLGGGAGAAPNTPAGLGTTTQVLHGNAAGAPSWAAITPADVAPALDARSLASFGVDMTGATDTTAAFQTALRSGVPLTCLGTVKVTSLVTVTNTDVSLSGLGSANGCVLNYTTNQSMIMLTETGNQLRSNNRVRFEHLKIVPQAAISSVAGATHTAAIDIEYPLGGAGTISPSVQVFDVQVQPSANANYIINCLYINDTVAVKVDHFFCEGERDTYNSNISAIVINGTHTPAEFTITDSQADFVGIGVNAVQVATGGWQGLRVHNFDCIYAANCISARGSLDATSDQLVVDHVEGPVQNYGVLATNVNHASIHDNYFFLSDVPITGGAHATFPTCVEMDWTVAVGSNGASGDIHDNTCDGAQVTGYTARYGVGVTGISRTNLASTIGPNQLTNLEFGIGLTAGTAGFTIAKQALKGVITEFQNNGTAGDNTMVPPLAITDGSSQKVGLVGELMTQTLVAGSAVALSTGAAKTVTSVSLTPGIWQCSGGIGFLPNAATVINAIAGGINTATNTLPGLAGFFLDVGTAGSQGFTTGIGASMPLNPIPINVTVTTPVYLVAQSTFATNTMSAYGTINCWRFP